jgi:hypothetical protein
VFAGLIAQDFEEAGDDNDYDYIFDVASDLLGIWTDEDSDSLRADLANVILEHKDALLCQFR